MSIISHISLLVATRIKLRSIIKMNINRLIYKREGDKRKG
jgi:hypothetical protein